MRSISFSLLFLVLMSACSEDEPGAAGVAAGASGSGGSGGTAGAGAGGNAGAAGSQAGASGAGVAGAGAGGSTGQAGASGEGGAAGTSSGGQAGQGGASGGEAGGAGQGGASSGGQAGTGGGGESGAGQGGGGQAGSGGGSEPVQAAEGEAKGWNGIGRLQESMTCTAVLLATSASGQSPAYVATNSHCVQEWALLESSNRVLRDQPPAPDARMFFRYYGSEGQVSVLVKRHVWSTMKGLDLAIVELDTTLGALAAQGITPLPLAAGPATQGSELTVVGAPLLGSVEESFLRKASCQAGASADVIERHWHWFDLQRNDCPDIVEGSSGSPLLDAQGKVTGLINTTTRGAKYACSLGAPCEVGAGAATLLPATSYTVPMVGVGGCFDAQGVFSVELSTCPLDRGQQLGLLSYPLSRQAPIDAFSQQKARWGVELATDGWSHLRYKTGPAATVRCREPAGYGDPVPVSAQPLQGLQLGPEEGPQVLCVQGGPSATLDAAWQPLDFVTEIVSYLDSTPPQSKPVVYVLDGDGGVRVEPAYDPPEFSVFDYVVGPPSLDCATTQDWKKYKKFPVFIPLESLPATFCIRGEDEVGNRGAPFAIAVPEP